MDEVRSPFPGMDPYLEARWRDVHASLVLYTRDQIQSQVTPGLRARVEDRVLLDAPLADDGNWFYPDVRAVHRRPEPARGPDAATGVAVAEPHVVEKVRERAIETFIQLIDPLDNARVVTVIEFLSPSNKSSGKDQDAYMEKQEQLRDAGVSLVEIDLLRGGERVLQIRPRKLPPHLRLHYAACVFRATSRAKERYENYGFDLRLPLPAIRIPLRKQDPDARLDLQALIAKCYTNGGYDDIDYRQSPPPPALDAADLEWADVLLRETKKR